MLSQVRDFINANSEKLNHNELPEFMSLAGSCLTPIAFEDLVKTLEAAGIDTENARLGAFGLDLKQYVDFIVQNTHDTSWSRLRFAMNIIFDYQLSIEDRINYVLKNKEVLGLPNIKPLEDDTAFAIPDYDLGCLKESNNNETNCKKIYKQKLG